MAALVDIFEAPGLCVDVTALLKLRFVAMTIPERRYAPGARPGDFATARRGRGLEVHDTRLFAYGDDVRHIDHNTTARTGRTHVRTYRDERDRTTMLIADFRPSMLWGTRRALRSVAAAEVLTLIGWRACQDEGRVGLIAFGAGEPLIIAPRAKERGMVSVIGGLARAHRSALAQALADPEGKDPPLQHALEMAVRTIPIGGSVFLASALDDLGDGFETSVTLLKSRSNTAVILMTDAFENNAPAGTYPIIDHTGASRWISAITRKPPHDKRAALLRSLGIDMLQLNASLDHEAMADQLGRMNVRF